ncbi:prenyltransferase/squalene oxidase repeat-containing protein [Streptomyces sp. RFCAC02]|uniref:prenyltransferase/squalene oxidase repeat-containing protein n=1 Tax=Streptomyces sp. RFCAC02 TaxID=2499143 RepID=UPI00101FFB2B|nr:prenyltransferase/squalene oxidase repeat-containing protein [Streptomyces sp. RFCAC02]
MTRPQRPRAATLLTAALLASAALAGSGTAARADAPPDLADPAAAAATWTVAQLTDGSNASGDHGLTADIVLGLASTGTAGDAQRAATDWLAENAADYVTRGAPDSGTVFAGGTAKLALVAAAEHRDPSDFGGLDLTALLLAGLQDTGRISDAGSAGDMSNQFSQSLAVLALERTGDLPDLAVDFLASTQCADGGFPLSLRRNPDRCTSDTDSTGLAVQALIAAGHSDGTDAALDWLEDGQGEDGGFGYNATAVPNSNSTALAVQALVAGGRDEAADLGVTWLRAMQVGCAGAAGDRGAVGYLDPVADGMALRSTAQVVPALAGVPLGDIDAPATTTPGVSGIDCTPDEGQTDGGASGDPGTDDPQDPDEPGDPQDPDDGTSGGTDPGDTDPDDTDPDDTGTGGTTTGGTDSGGTDTGGTTTDGTTTGGTDSGGTTTGGTDTGGTGGVVPDGSLASTGSSPLPLVGLAAALLAAGAAATLVARRRRATH